MELRVRHEGRLLAGQLRGAITAPHLIYQKAVADLRLRHHTLVFTAEPVVTAPGEEVVYEITEKGWHRYQSEEDRPGPAQASEDAESRTGLPVRAITFDDHQCVQGSRVQAVLPLQPLPGRRLQHREPEYSAPVAGDDPAHGRVAEVADAVEENDGMEHEISLQRPAVSRQGRLPGWEGFGGYEHVAHPGGGVDGAHSGEVLRAPLDGDTIGLLGGFARLVDADRGDGATRGIVRGVVGDEAIDLGESWQKAIAHSAEAFFAVAGIRMLVGSHDQVHGQAPLRCFGADAAIIARPDERNGTISGRRLSGPPRYRNARTRAQGRRRRPSPCRWR